ncbi:MAG: hypothetical protein WC725_00930 [Patescibacteria group bacterium]|jgi:hypothetical protein
MDHKAWVVAVDMGYGHQRAAYPLRELSPNGKVLIANNYAGIPRRDHRIWNSGRRTYEFFSRTTGIPIIGKYIWNAFDKLQSIDQFYPRRDLSWPSIQVRQEYSLIRTGFGKDLIKQLNTEDIPLITTFFTVAFMAEEHKFKNDIYVVICDSDISRAWVALNPAKSRIKYLAPCRRVVERLKLYGVKDQNIFLTGFPLPSENIGLNFADLKSDLSDRVINLDPEHRYRSKYGDTIKRFLPGIQPNSPSRRPLTVTFGVGGAGAQRNIAHDILMSLREKITKEEVCFNLVAGSRNDVYSYFKKAIIDSRLIKNFGRNLNIIFAPHKEDYFKLFNNALRTTDVLWTKPSELVFYSGLGLPIIMAPSVGSQEDYNRTWLKTIGAGISQNNPKYTSEWLFDWVKSGWLAEAAVAGFLDGRQFGVKNIEDVLFKGVIDPSADDELL